MSSNRATSSAYYLDNKMTSKEKIRQTMLPLRWTKHPDLVVIPTPGDGSCALHAIIQAFHPDYQAGRNSDGTAVNRMQFVREFRNELAEMLNKPVDGESGKIWYEQLSRGTLSEFSKATSGLNDVPDLSKEGFARHLRSSSWLGQEIVEYVASVLKIGVFVLLEDLEGTTRGLYSLGKDNDLYFNGYSKAVIIVSHSNRHFSTIGRREGDGVVRTFFDMDDSLIKEFLTDLS